MTLKRSGDLIKRIFDLCGAFIGLLLLSPLIILESLTIGIVMGWPVIYNQIRPGYEGITFEMYKFRTMTDERDENGRLLPDDIRLTRFGMFLRSSSLDELPELFNVLKGDMSLVGPRPLLIKYLDRYTPEQARRHEVKPGITGWAQVNGRNALSWEKKFERDVWYVDNCSLWLDLKILFMTILKVFKREGISADGEATMGEFMGSAITNQYLNVEDTQNEAAASRD